MKSLDAYREALIGAYTLANLIRQSDVTELLAMIEHAGAFGPILDPTAWRANIDRLREDKSVIEILVTAKRKLDALPWPERGDRATAGPSVSSQADGDASRTVFGQGSC